ncbi:MAG: glycogen synthase GlgA [Acidobacteriota bacterium]
MLDYPAVGPALRILMVVSEVAPYSKTGGLGDVGGALPAALARLGHQVTVVSPRYRGVETGRVVARFEPGAWPGAPAWTIHAAQDAGSLQFWFLDCPDYFARDGLYGAGAGDFPDNHLRFGFLARAALEGAARLEGGADVLHAHDWQAGLAPVYLRTRYGASRAFTGTGAVFTIHNLSYQGLFRRRVLPALDLGEEVFTPQGLEYWGDASFLKGGIAFADIVTTVSRRYAQEIQTPEQGFGFEGILQGRSSVLVGIPNGIDTDIWNPATDPHLPEPFESGHLEGKLAAKRALLERFGMASGEQRVRPLIGMVSRMVDQKGLDLIAASAEQLMRLDATWIVLGTGEAHYESMWRSLAVRHPDRVGVTIGFSEELAHLIEGGADLFLMPSKFEPCGLNQMYSLRYGTVPVVRATGGLDDTVQQVDGQTGRGTGFKFGDYTPAGLLAVLQESLRWYGRPDAWRQIQEEGMRQDHSWDASARRYVAAYERARQARAASGGR